METISTSIRLPRDLHDRLLLLQAKRQKEHPRRRVTMTEVAVEVMERGLDETAQDKIAAAILELRSAPTTQDGSAIAAAVRDRVLAALEK